MPSHEADAAPKFLMGRIVATPGVLAAVPRDEIDFALALHQTGNWGELCEEDKKANDSALAGEGRLLSAYRFGSGVRFYVITESDWSVTTALLPSEY